MISLAKVHDRPTGTLVLVDRLWPRGISKEQFRPALWAKGAAPSTSLRKWLHDGGDWAEFVCRYRAELDAALDDVDVRSLFELVRAGDVTLVYASKNRDRNHAHVLAEWLRERVE